MKKNTIKKHGYYIEELEIGQNVMFSKSITEKDIENFSELSGDKNPVHIDKKFAEKTIFKKKIAHGFLTASFISAAIGTKLPGPGCIYLKQYLKFLAPVYPGDNIKTKITVKKIDITRKRVTLETDCFCNEKKILEGEAVILVASNK